MALSHSQKPKDSKEFAVETIEFRIENYKDLLTQFNDHKILFGTTKKEYKLLITELEILLKCIQ